MKSYTLLAAIFLVSSLSGMDSEIISQEIRPAMDLWHTKLEDWVIGIKLFSESEHSKFYGDCSSLPETKRYLIWCLNGKSLLSSLKHIVVKKAFTDDERDALEQIEAVDSKSQN